MLKVGITGGIGSGKSTACRVFEALGIPVFYADQAGRYLMEHDAAMIASIKALFGDDIYISGRLQRERIANIVFQYPEKLLELNAVVHPAARRFGLQWMAQQAAHPYALKEAALFFESATNVDMDVMIGVTAPTKTRILRVARRDGISQEQILARMANQMDEREKMNRCDFVIDNDDQQAILPQILHIHNSLIAISRATS